ncbi:MAG: hypothetical protein AB7S38_32240 [Vulcanimicrobiota bacterium]
MSVPAHSTISILPPSFHTFRKLSRLGPKLAKTRENHHGDINIALNQAFGGFNVRPTNQTQRVGTFTVTAGVRSDGVKPAEVLVFEKGEFRNRNRGFGFGNFQFDTTLPNARVGKTYQAQIFWGRAMSSWTRPTSASSSAPCFDRSQLLRNGNKVFRALTTFVPRYVLSWLD